MSERKSPLPAVALALLLCALSLLPSAAQKRRLPDKAIVGTWVLFSKQFEGERPKYAGREYSQIKYYGPTGEYACAEVVKVGKYFTILPHEYGTYTYNKGQYTEMGRKGEFVIKGNTASGHWRNSLSVWKKVTIPKDLLSEVLLRCKHNEAPPQAMQREIRKYILNK